MQITLKGNTNRLRQLIKQHGNTWWSDGVLKNMPCFNGELGISITSLDKKHTRNIRFPQDVES